MERANHTSKWRKITGSEPLNETSEFELVTQPSVMPDGCHLPGLPRGIRSSDLGKRPVRLIGNPILSSNRQPPCSPTRDAKISPCEHLSKFSLPIWASYSAGRSLARVGCIAKTAVPGWRRSGPRAVGWVSGPRHGHWPRVFPSLKAGCASHLLPLLSNQGGNRAWSMPCGFSQLAGGTREWKLILLTQ
jgi:hypothetical protein